MRSVGSAATLAGRCYNLSLFVCSPDETLSLAEKHALYASETAARQWIVSEAQRYGVSVDFKLGVFPSCDPAVKWQHVVLGAPPERKKWLKASLEQHGYADPLQLLTHVKRKHACANAHAIIYVKGKIRNGWSSTPWFGHYNDKDFFFESIVLSSSMNGTSVSPGTIAHELLHLYGAWDFHHNSGAPLSVEQQVRAHFPDSIMLGSTGFPDRVVDPITAHWLGWTDSLPSWATELRPHYY